MKIFAIIVLALAFTGCHKGKQTESGRYVDIDYTKQDEDFVIPTSLWKAFEESYPELTVLAEPKEGEKKEEKKEDKKSEATDKKMEAKLEEQKKEREELLKRRPSIDGLPFNVTLKEKSEGLLNGHDYKVSFGQGGGLLDLKDFYPESKNGTFYLNVNYEKEMDPKTTKIFYLSNAKYRQSEGFGSGCNKYFEITKYWKENQKGDGLALNTVRQRHVSVVAGTFFFVSPVAGKLRLGRLTVTDSRHQDLLCASN